MSSLSCAPSADFLIGGGSNWKVPPEAICRPIFDPLILDLLDALAVRMLADPASRRHGDVAAFAFWIRRSALEGLAGEYRNSGFRLGRGTVFHIGPANVPIMSAYSLVMGLLAGNRNLVRLPSQDHPQLTLVCAHLEALLAEPRFEPLRPYISCVRYARQSTQLTADFSATCDIRVVWGGDATIAAIRDFPLRAGACELAFPDRFSLAVIDSDAWLAQPDASRAVRGFFNDALQTDQTSCSSPRLVVWLGSSVGEARAKFWQAVGIEAANRREPVAGQVAKALEFAYGLLAKVAGSRLEPVASGLVRLWSDVWPTDSVEGHPGGGVFMESVAANLSALAPMLVQRCQTLSYFGVDPVALVDMVCRSGALGCLRIVPLGQTRTFSLIWDGHDTIRALSRAIDVVADENRG